MITADQVVARARAAVGKHTIYTNGKGGFRPMNELPHDERKRCDCSGFVAWCLGCSRHVTLPLYAQYLGNWVETSAIVRDALNPFGMFVKVEVPRPGDVIVYGDGPLGQGHCGIITEVIDAPGLPVAQQVAKVVHCSGGNYRRTGQAIQETSPAAWLKRPETIIARCVGVDFGEEAEAA